MSLAVAPNLFPPKHFTKWTPSGINWATINLVRGSRGAVKCRGSTSQQLQCWVVVRRRYRATAPINDRRVDNQQWHLLRVFNGAASLRREAASRSQRGATMPSIGKTVPRCACRCDTAAARRIIVRCGSQTDDACSCATAAWVGNGPTATCAHRFSRKT